MKKLVIMAIMVVVSCTVLSGCRPDNRGPLHYGLNLTWEFDGGNATVFEAIAVDSYCTPEGSQYRAEPGGALFVVKCRIVLEPGWQILRDTEVYCSQYQEGKLICDPISEISDSGEELQVLLFGLSADAYSGRIQEYKMELFLRKDNQMQIGYFHFWRSNTTK